ncbi:MAG: hypothetical protein EXX96DRAFT_607410 [Benjaminiella poitrasii]|nr:MAG: hypothetical protein EXX96DRAFT_607410 [Benjaminiella poitrasii]
MMTDDNTVAIATPTRFLIENGEWNLTPSLSGAIQNEINPFECNFQQRSGNATTTTTMNPIKINESSTLKWPVESSNTSSFIYHDSPEPEMTTIQSPPTPPMSLSQSPSTSSSSFSLTSEQNMNTTIITTSPQPEVIAPANTLVMADVHHHHPSSPESSYRRSKRYQQRQEVTSTTTTNNTHNTTSSIKEEQLDEPILKPTRTASVHSGRKRRIVFEGDDAEERRKKFLERNRVAAYKCRQKKKNWMQELEQKAEIQNAYNEELRAVVGQLKEESMYLRNLLLTHGNCNCESVQAYLRKTSAEITNNVTPTNSNNNLSYSRRSSLVSNNTMPPPPPPIPYPNSFKSTTMPPSFSETSTGLTPFLNTVINKTQPTDYFSQTHTNES